MKSSLVELLRCPTTGSKLTLENAVTDSTGILDGTLRGESTEYPVVRGVPVLLDPGTFLPGQGDTRNSFSEKWLRAPDYKDKTKAHYTQWYLDRYGFNTVDRLREFLNPFEKILDAGTAHGRDAETYATNSAATIFGVDISEGIYSAYRDLDRLANVHLIQADLTKLPFPKKFFDFIACDQVLHHTPDTHASFKSLLTHLAPGGYLATYVYKVKAPVREFCDDLIRAATVEMSPDECMVVSEAITKFGKSLSDMKLAIDVPEDIPLLGIKAGKHDLQRFIYWHMFKCYWNDTMDYQSNVITNFDWYHPRHAHRHTPEEVRGWIAEAGMETVHFDEQESGISVLLRARE